MQERAAASANQYLPYKFTGKELDPETGLYYFGARYYDAKVSRWISADPILNDYLPDRNVKNINKLPGGGGVFTTLNLDLYHYGGNNPLKFIDPDGTDDVITVKNSNAAYSKFESTTLAYKDNTLKGPKFALMKAYAKVKGLLGGSLSKQDVVDFFGKPDASFDNMSSLPDDPSSSGTVASGKMYSYQQKDMSWTKQSFILGSELGDNKVPQDSKFNNGINPRTGKSYVENAFLHPARSGNPASPDYTKGSEGCPTRYGFYQMYNFLKGRPDNSGMKGRYIIFR